MAIDQNNPETSAGGLKDALWMIVMVVVCIAVATALVYGFQTYVL